MFLRPILQKFMQMISLWGPTAVQMGLIFYYSSRPAGSSALERFPLPAGIGHFVGYLILALLFYRAFNGGSFRFARPAAFYAFAASVLYGVSDEIHQIFVPGRHASVVDVLIDAAGAAAGVTLVWLWSLIKHKLLEGSLQSKD